MLGLLALLGALWTAHPCDAGVCTCIGAPDASAALQRSDAVFVGTVISVRDTVVDQRSHPRHQQYVTLRVERAWKGVESPTIGVFTEAAGSMCVFPMNRGESYLVFAGTSFGVLGTGRCSRSQRLERATDDLRALGEPVRRWSDPSPADPLD